MWRYLYHTDPITCQKIWHWWLITKPLKIAAMASPLACGAAAVLRPLPLLPPLPMYDHPTIYGAPGPYPYFGSPYFPYANYGLNNGGFAPYENASYFPPSPFVSAISSGVLLPSVFPKSINNVDYSTPPILVNFPPTNTNTNTNTPPYINTPPVTPMPPPVIPPTNTPEPSSIYLLLLVLFFAVVYDIYKIR